MRGRKPQPTALKLLRGNPGKRPVNLREPQHGALDAAVPPDLVDPEAQDEWRRLAAVLITRGQVTTVDRAVLTGYCVKYAQWIALEREAAKHPWVVKTPSGYPIPNPALGMANKAFGLMLQAATELGITPSARSRVSANLEPWVPTPDSKWAGVLK
jgi:P27 family predicted phage terminase small subunit